VEAIVDGWRREAAERERSEALIADIQPQKEEAQGGLKRFLADGGFASLREAIDAQLTESFINLLESQ
jgi:hypothetical protein